MFEWATGLGAKLEKVEWGADEHGGSGLFVREDNVIRSGDVVLSLPRVLRVGKDRVVDGTGGIARVRALTHDVPSLSALALLLLSLLPLNSLPNGNADCDDGAEESGWRLYARLLPSLAQVGNAVAMGNSEVAAWTLAYGQDYGDAIASEQRRARCCVEYIKDVLGGGHGGDDAALRWAIAMVVSRSHAFGSSTERWLTPVLDLANHRPEGDHEEPRDVAPALAAPPSPPPSLPSADPPAAPPAATAAATAATPMMTTSAPAKGGAGRLKKGGARLETDMAGNIIMRWYGGVQQSTPLPSSGDRGSFLGERCLLPGDEVYLDYQVQEDDQLVAALAFSPTRQSSDRISCSGLAVKVPGLFWSRERHESHPTATSD